MELHRSFAIWLIVLGIGVYCRGDLQSSPSRPMETAAWITKDSQGKQPSSVMTGSSVQSFARSESSSRSMSMSEGGQPMVHKDDPNLDGLVRLNVMHKRMKRTPKGGGGKGGGGKGGGGKGGGGKGDGKKLTKAEKEAIKKAAEEAERKRKEEEEKKKKGG